ncbi:fibroblast growth factor 1-like isoform X2 [Paramuricea clavata]|uniref:Fibroblast growth factor n=1 Tax=Paramuricea clavata TaxID=317549 RepID=A0A7D9HXV5_PARCT|nr:fibroblast growth factor 1-like isoform X2 [Paramuricea clavata]
MSTPLPKSKRKRKPPSHRQNILKVHNFSHNALKLNTPTNSRKYVLWSRNGHVYLQANKNLTPGTNRTRGPRAMFVGEMMATGIVRLRNTATNRYLAINQRGRLLLQRKANDDCLFREGIGEQSFNTYASYKYYKTQKFDIFIAVKYGGDIKSPVSTGIGQKAIMFNTLRT